jgi:hypothetical protein
MIKKCLQENQNTKKMPNSVFHARGEKTNPGRNDRMKEHWRKQT